MHILRDENNNIIPHGEEHTHEHVHADGTVHTHEHHHHDGEHEHHDHEHHHHHHEETPLDELKAMLKYMVGHNAAHVKETEELAAQLKEAKPEVYEMIAKAVEIYEEGNAKLKEALDMLNA